MRAAFGVLQPYSTSGEEVDESPLRCSPFGSCAPLRATIRITVVRGISPTSSPEVLQPDGADFVWRLRVLAERRR